MYTCRVVSASSLIRAPILNSGRVITSGLGTDRGVVRAGHRLTHLKAITAHLCVKTACQNDHRSLGVSKEGVHRCIRVV